ncbi:PAS sensor protein [Gemmatirosa kalamazoonensis]|uniref:histidine kinase n=1 Tax=Gemmatirosa kalamazoonensis TaxID=861299 RepID=W0RKT8_9BACT|nr:response regulator [Gemmatirosa kalamazoonensis]AHG90053.1 PAS sensor protein [Gemmatirosa kalamazoonensis]
MCAVAAPFVLGTALRVRERVTAARVEAGRRALDVAGLVAARLDDRARDAGTVIADAFRGARLPDGATITILDAQGVVLGHGPRGEELVGRRMPNLAALPDAGRREAIEVVGSDGAPWLAAFATAPATGWRVRVAVPRRAADAAVRGEVARDVLLTAAALALALGLAAVVGRRVVGSLDSTFDEMAATIDARTAALRRIEQRYQLLFEACPLPLFLSEFATHRILAVNDAACAEYGYTREEFTHLTLLDLRPAEERLRFLAVSRALTEAQGFRERSSTGVWRHRHKDGSIAEVEVFTVITEFEGQPVRLSVSLDVTARRRAERALQESQDQLRRAQKMEALGRFAGGIAHDFNNLLTGILGYCDLALSDEGLPSETREDFSAIRDAAQRAAGLTGRILAFSRGRVMQPVALDVNDVVEGLQPMLGRMIGEHIRLESDLSPSAGTVLADSGQVEQVVLNLALNARDAMPDGGVLSISTSDVHVEHDDAHHPDVPPGRWTVLEVRDTGVGMDAETQTHIFEPFFTTKDRARGTGLGLATVYAIVQQGGGAVRVWSAPGAGSRFAVYLPRVDEPAEERRTPPAPQLAVGGDETILLVEDEEAVRAIARETLIRRGYRVITAADGPSAIEVARRHPEIDLLLTDVVMPGMSGRELAELLARDRHALKVLFMTGYTEDEVLHRGVSSDDVALLAKPFTPDTLCAEVRAVLDAEQPSAV